MTLEQIKKENDKDLEEYKQLQKKLLFDNALEERKNSDQLQIAMNIIDRVKLKMKSTK